MRCFSDVLLDFILEICYNEKYNGRNIVYERIFLWNTNFLQAKNSLPSENV